VDALTFFGLKRTDDPRRWRMPIVPGLTSGRGALFGGCGLGAAIEVMEQLTGRPCVWATAQYLTYTEPPSVLELDAVEVVRGHHISQARVIAHVGETEVLTVLGALGNRPFPYEGQWARRPDVPSPEECAPRPHMNEFEDTIRSRLDERLAAGRPFYELTGEPGDGNSAIWVWLPELLEMSAPALAIIGDFVPSGIGQALGWRAGGNSLDNTLRVAHRTATDWVLADIRVHAVADGFGHGLVHLWAEDGTLLGTASQSTIVRAWHHDAAPDVPAGESLESRG
jgi:acyl-CoA thioesterase II